MESSKTSQPTQGTFSFTATEHDVFMLTRPKTVKPIPLDMPGGCGNLNYSLYRPQLFTTSNVYLDCPIWRRPLETKTEKHMTEYMDNRWNAFDNAYRIIFEDMREMNK